MLKMLLEQTKAREELKSYQENLNIMQFKSQRNGNKEELRRNFKVLKFTIDRQQKYLNSLYKEFAKYRVKDHQSIIPIKQKI
jgi:hypothetical protein